MTVVSVGMLLLALWLILTGLSSLIRRAIPSQAMGVLAVLAGILLSVGRQMGSQKCRSLD
jgi:hypothetical protein